MTVTAETALRLRIELIPKPCWERNLRNTLPQGRWLKLSRDVRAAAGDRCEICGATERVQCDEQYAYDDERHTQRLVRLRSICQTCHQVMNFGRTRIIAQQFADRYPTLIEDVIAHFLRVNRVDRETFNRHATAAFVEWEARSAFAHWTLDYGDYAGLVREVEEMRARRRPTQ